MCTFRELVLNYPIQNIIKIYLNPQKKIVERLLTPLRIICCTNRSVPLLHWSSQTVVQGADCYVQNLANSSCPETRISNSYLPSMKKWNINVKRWLITVAQKSYSAIPRRTIDYLRCHIEDLKLRPYMIMNEMTRIQWVDVYLFTCLPVYL